MDDIEELLEEPDGPQWMENQNDVDNDDDVAALITVVSIEPYCT